MGDTKATTTTWTSNLPNNVYALTDGYAYRERARHRREQDQVIPQRQKYPYTSHVIALAVIGERGK